MTKILLKMSIVNIIYNIQWRISISAKMPLVELKKMAPQFAAFGERFVKNY